MKLVELIKKPLRGPVNKFRDFRAIKNFKRERKIKRGDKRIRVGFIVQYIPAWNKFKPIYDELKENDRFEVFLICVPIEIHSNKLDDPNDTGNKTYDYFVNNGYEAINALVGKNKWFEIKKLNLNYIFYPRPYNSFMPKKYVSGKVSKYAKICSIMYGMSMTEEILETSLNKNFFRNVYCYFAESKNAAEKNIANFSRAHKLGLQKTVSYGMPVLVEMLKQKNAKSDIWDFANGKFKIMWTPRWTTDLKLGGSNFFTFKDFLIDYVKNSPDVAAVFRPHPLALNNFVKNGDMTEEEAKSFIESCNKDNKIFLDNSEDYIATFWGSDALVTDISGIMPEYFVTGKPLIYCASNMILTPAEHTRKLLEGCYVVNDVEELKQCLNDLRNGLDPLKEIRQRIIIELWGENLYQCNQKIIEELSKTAT